MTLIVKNVKLVEVRDLVSELAKRTGMYETEVQDEVENALLEDEYYDDGDLDRVVEIGVIPADELDYGRKYIEAPGIAQTVQFLEAWNDLLADLNVDSLFIRLEEYE